MMIARPTLSPTLRVPSARRTLRASRRRSPRGTTLLEALLAFLVLSVGILTIGRVQTHLRLGSDIARQRSEAVRLGQEELESLRGFAMAAASAGVRSYAEIASGAATFDTAGGYATNTRYQLLRDVETSPDGASKRTAITVGWTDRRGDAQRIVLSSIIVGHDPAYSAALALAPHSAPVHGAFARSPWIPLFARDLGNGKSAFKPITAGNLAFVLDNRSGLVVAECSAIDPALATRDLSPSNLGTCTAGIAYLVSGTIRFSLSSPPSTTAANDLPLDIGAALALTGSSYPMAPSCSAEAVKTVSYTSAGSLRIDDVAIGATPAVLGVASWSETGDRHVVYHCLVHPRPDGRWSGRVTLVPSGWTLGTGPADRRVCRYTADLDASGAIDGNAEHPADYADVTTPLADQNFLVIPGNESCPAGAPVRIVGAADDVFVDTTTLPHQP
jgi:Tfp pilus assembly protein PilV